jgi:hypothetical protein
MLISRISDWIVKKINLMLAAFAIIFALDIAILLYATLIAQPRDETAFSLLVWLLACFAAIGLVSVVVSRIRGIQLSQEGIVRRSLFGTITIAWDDVTDVLIACSPSSEVRLIQFQCRNDVVFSHDRIYDLDLLEREIDATAPSHIPIKKHTDSDSLLHSSPILSLAFIFTPALAFFAMIFVLDQNWVRAAMAGVGVIGICGIIHPETYRLFSGIDSTLGLERFSGCSFAVLAFHNSATQLAQF